MPHWRSDLNADLWSQVVLFLDPADHAAVRCVSVELRGSIADHYVNALLLVVEGASRDGTHFPLAGSFRTAALIDLPIDPPCGVPSWGAYFALVGGRDALLDEIWRRPLFEGAVVLVDAVEAHEASWRPDGLCAWQRVALAHCIGGRDLMGRRPMERAGLFSMLCGDGYCPAGSAAASAAKYCVCLNFDELRDYLPTAPDDGVAVLSFLPDRTLHHLSPAHLAFALDWQDQNPPTAFPQPFVITGCTTLQSVEFREMRSVTRIGQWVLSGCDHLANVSLMGLPNLKSIDHYFGACCAFLRSVRLLGLPNLEEIGDCFLAGCRLTEVYFNGLPKLRTIGNGFCWECPQLSFVDFSQFAHVTTFGTDAFKGCSEALQPVAQRWIESRRPRIACRLQ